MQKLLFRGALSKYTGYGSDGIGIVESMSDLGYEVTSLPTGIQAPLPVETALSLTRTPDGYYDIYLVKTDPGAIVLSPALKEMSGIAVWWTMWEAPSFEEKTKKGFTEQDIFNIANEFDLVLGYDDITLSALRPHVTKPRLEKLIGGYDSSIWLPEERPAQVKPRDWTSDVFRFGMLGQLGRRKNPEVAVNAFKLVKDGYGDKFNAELHLKFQTVTFHKRWEDWAPGVKIHTGLWSHLQMREFYESLHCYVASSRGEGKNLPPIEALTTGCPVMGTMYGGHTEWMMPEYTWPIPFRLEEWDLGLGAEVEVEKLADLMWYVYNNRGECKDKGEAGSRVLPAMLDWSAVMRRFIAIVVGD